MVYNDDVVCGWDAGVLVYQAKTTSTEPTCRTGLHVKSNSQLVASMVVYRDLRGGMRSR
jgi:hypothetical protein